MYNLYIQIPKWYYSAGILTVSDRNKRNTKSDTITNRCPLLCYERTNQYLQHKELKIHINVKTCDINLQINYMAFVWIPVTYFHLKIFMWNENNYEVTTDIFLWLWNDVQRQGLLFVSDILLCAPMIWNQLIAVTGVFSNPAAQKYNGTDN